MTTTESIPIIRLPRIKDIPPWPEHSFKSIQESLKVIKTVRSGSGKGSNRFREVCRELLELAFSSQGNKIYSHLKKPIHLRAYTYLLANSPHFLEKHHLSESILATFQEVRNPLSALTLIQLILSYFKHFDQLTEKNQLDIVCRYIKAQLAMKSRNNRELAAYNHSSEILFDKDAPLRIANKAIKENTDLLTQSKRLGLRGHEEGRFMFLCRNAYYIGTLENIDIGESHHILNELTKPEVYNAPYKEGQLIGHKVIEILIDRSAGLQISETWQNTIMNIAGDPRVPRTDKNYQQWWQTLGEKRRALMRGWLSRFDLKLFLKVLEQSAQDAGNEDMNRMFPPRKKFMEGLLSEGVITESRLFLCRQAEWFLKRQYKNEDLPNYATVDSAQTSMIYLNLGNKAHMLEGSHSFPVKLFNQLATTSPLNDYSRNYVQDVDLRKKEEKRYIQEFGSHGFLSKAHYDLSWQHDVLEFLKKRGFRIPASSVIRRESLRTYKNRYGA